MKFRYNTKGIRHTHIIKGKLDFIKIKNLCVPKDTIKKVKYNAQKGRRDFQVISGKEFVSRVYKESLQCSIMKNTFPNFENGQRTSVDFSLKKIYKLPIST